MQFGNISQDISEYLYGSLSNFTKIFQDFFPNKTVRVPQRFI